MTGPRRLSWSGKAPGSPGGVKRRLGAGAGGACRRALPWKAFLASVAAVALVASAFSTGALAEGGRSRLALLLGEGGAAGEDVPQADGDSLKVLIPGQARAAEDPGGRASRNLIGGSFFASGLFLCSWGIVSWQMREDQCCPPRNTENALKIIVGVVMINAGLFYFLGGAD